MAIALKKFKKTRHYNIPEPLKAKSLSIMSRADISPGVTEWWTYKNNCPAKGLRNVSKKSLRMCPKQRTRWTWLTFMIRLCSLHQNSWLRSKGVVASENNPRSHLGFTATLKRTKESIWMSKVWSIQQINYSRKQTKLLLRPWLRSNAVKLNVNIAQWIISNSKTTLRTFSTILDPLQTLINKTK